MFGYSTAPKGKTLSPAPGTLMPVTPETTASPGGHRISEVQFGYKGQQPQSTAALAPQGRRQPALWQTMITPKRLSIGCGVTAGIGCFLLLAPYGYVSPLSWVGAAQLVGASLVTFGVGQSVRQASLFLFEHLQSRLELFLLDRAQTNLTQASAQNLTDRVYAHMDAFQENVRKAGAILVTEQEGLEHKLLTFAQRMRELDAVEQELQALPPKMAQYRAKRLGVVAGEKCRISQGMEACQSDLALLRKAIADWKDITSEVQGLAGEVIAEQGLKAQAADIDAKLGVLIAQNDDDLAELEVQHNRLEELLGRIDGINDQLHQLKATHEVDQIEMHG